MRTCIFCGERATTNEDAWPLWLMRRLLQNTTGTMESQRGQNSTQVWKLARPELKVKFVCAACNNGWMSKLEVQVIPIVEKLFNDNSITLDSKAQEALSSWGVKNSMVFEALRLNEPWFYTSEERLALKDNVQLPMRTYVWLARCVEHNGAICMATNLSGITAAPMGKATGYVTTMGFGTLAIQVLSVRLAKWVSPNAEMKLRMKGGTWDDATVSIWPVQEPMITWPPSLGISGEAGIQAFNDRW
jgi:hypothetical protein